MIKPELEALRPLAESGEYDVAPISMELLSDVRTPIETLRILLNVSRHCYLLESAGDNELTWSHWFFSVINTTESLHRIDLYAQDCLRVLISGKHTKARYNVRYEDLKRLGYRSLVHAYYDFDPGEKT